MCRMHTGSTETWIALALSPPDPLDGQIGTTVGNRMKSPLGVQSQCKLCRSDG